MVQLFADAVYLDVLFCLEARKFYSTLEALRGAEPGVEHVIT